MADINIDSCKKEVLADCIGILYRKFKERFQNEPINFTEVKHGEWICYPECLRYENAYSNDHIVCSECREVFSILDNDTDRFDFCPNCGCDMRQTKGGE